MKTSKHIILLAGILWITTGCEITRFEDDPAKLILGKWEIVEMGNWPGLEPYPALEYIEYLPDSMIGVYDYETKEYTYAKEKYWIDDSLLYRSIIREDGYKIIIKYKHEFFDHNKKLRLDFYKILANYNTFIFKRIK